MARQLIDSMVGPWSPEEYRDTYTDRVKELIEAKRQGAEVSPAEEAPAATDVRDLMEVLRRSVDAARGRRTTKTAAKKSTPAKKTSTAAKKRKSTAASAKKTSTAAKKSTAASAKKKAAPAKKAARKKAA